MKERRRDRWPTEVSIPRTPRGCPRALRSDLPPRRHPLRKPALGTGAVRDRAVELLKVESDDLAQLLAGLPVDDDEGQRPHLGEIVLSEREAPQSPTSRRR